MLRRFFSVFFVISSLALAAALVDDFLLTAVNPNNQLGALLAPALVFFANLFALDFLHSERAWKWKHLLPLVLIFISGCTVSAFMLATSYVDTQLKTAGYTTIYNDCYKIWGARGLVREGPDITADGTQNSIEAIQLAFDSGARGSEVDIFFDRARGEFIVSHDYPYNRKNGVILTLEELFNATGSRGYFWLDFKKLRHLNPAQLAESVAELERISTTGDLKHRLYIEGEAPFSLAAYRDAGFNTIFDTHPLADSNLLTPAIINFYKIVYYFGNFSVMAMNYGDVNDPIYGARTRALLGPIPVFIYHVADDSRVLQQLAELNTVRVVLVENHSLNRYHVNACPGNS